MVTAEMYEIISRLNREQGITIIMISHDLQGALKYGTKILHMESGAYFFELPPSTAVPIYSTQ